MTKYIQTNCFKAVIAFCLVFFALTAHGQVIVIDPGHGYTTDGRNPDGRTETEMATALAVGLKLRDQLSSQCGGWTVRMTRTTRDGWISLSQRRDMSNSWGADRFLSIHCNAGGGSGTETFWCDRSNVSQTASSQFSREVQDRMAEGGNWLNRRSVEDASYIFHLGVLNSNNAVGVLNEIGFVDSPDADKLLDDGWRNRFASAYVTALQNSLGTKCTPPAPTQTTHTHIEAENYSGMKGIGTETCLDTGGGKNISNVNAGEYAYYDNISFPTSGTYLIEYRVASTSSSGIISADLNNGSTVLGKVDVPSTGDWQNWTTISHTVSVNAGTHRFGVKAIAGGWNLNWIKISKYSAHIQAESYSSMSGVSTETCLDTGGGKNVSHINDGDWMAYSNVHFPAAGTYLLEYRVASTNSNGVISADLNSGTTRLGQLNVPNTGGWQNWTTVSHTVHVEKAGIHALGVQAITGGWNLNWIQVTRQGQHIEAEKYSGMSGVGTETCTDFGAGSNLSNISAGDYAYYRNITFPATGAYEIEYRVASTNSNGIIRADLNNGNLILGEVSVPNTGGWQAWITVSHTVEVKAGTYSFGINAKVGGWNLNWIRIKKHGLEIQAEDFDRMSTGGVQVADCSPEEGGQYVGWIHDKDWFAFNTVNIPTAGKYLIEYRVASPTTGGKISTDLNYGAITLGQINVPNTGGWQNWTTISHMVTIGKAGTYSLGIEALVGGWNINWIRISKQEYVPSGAAARTAAAAPEEFALYPNPAENEFFVRFTGVAARGRIINSLGQTVLTLPVLRSGEVVNISSLKNGIYILDMDIDGKKVINKIIKQ